MVRRTPAVSSRQNFRASAQTHGNLRPHPLPWANPANIAFNKKTKSLLVTNHAGLTGLPDPSFLFAYLNDKSGELFKDDD